MSKTEFADLCFVGFGEAAQAFLSGWAPADPSQLRAYDIKTDSADTRATLLDRYASTGVTGTDSLAQALTGAHGVFCVVTADQALTAARAAAPYLQSGTFWFDCNSCAPGTKREAAAVIETAGARYVDVAAMAPVYPKRHRVPLLIAGPHADQAAQTLTDLGMCPEIAGDEVGRASTIKMVRSVMIKGIEAVTAECLLAARKAGVEADVLASLSASDPGINWEQKGAYALERMMVHGARRAAEMREVALTLQDLGLPRDMSRACAGWQDRVAGTQTGPDDEDLAARLDAVLARLARP